jgi:alpha-L-fucosidase
VNRRTFLHSTCAAATAAQLSVRPFVARPRPTVEQLAWQRNELSLFLHFGINTFTDREWGDGAENPALFAPADLDARQWARAARIAGFRALILTAKHHDGFCLWRTSTTRHSVQSSPWRNGEGDVVAELSHACRAERLGLGLYLSPWDRNAPSYGDGDRYNDFYCDQLAELLTRYGPITEVWFDGANGEGGDGRRQSYDWPRFHQVVRRHQPGALIFSDAGPDLRWVGNEGGAAGDPNWCPVDPGVVPFPGATGPDVLDMLQHGDPDGTVWRPAEADVSIRPGWFWHPAEDDRVKTGAEILEVYFLSAGRNAGLLLNVPPTRAGQLHERDLRSLVEFGELRERIFQRDLTAGAIRTQSDDGRRIQLRLPNPVEFDVIAIQEDIRHGQAVSAHHVEALIRGEWRTIAEGTTIGHKRLHRLAPHQTTQLRLVIEAAVAAPRIGRVGLHRTE